MCAVRDRLEHEDEQVRFAAVDAFAEVAGRSQAAVASILSLLEHKLPAVRQAALRALVSVMPQKGDLQVREALRARLTDEDARVRVEVLELLPEVLDSTDPVLVEAVSRAQDDDRRTEEAASQLAALWDASVS